MAYPNPISTTTQINYTIPSNDQISISVTDLQGRQLALLVDDQLFDKGTYQLDWTATHLETGTYLLQLKTTQTVLYQKLVVAR